MKNIAYAGALVALLDIDMDVVDRMLEEKFAQEKSAARIESQGAAARLPVREENTSIARCRSVWRRWTRTSDKILIDGNTATALGCVYAGAPWRPGIRSRRRRR